jgi:hypothetical protein
MKHMLYADKIYGPIELKENVLTQLINSKPMERLKHVSQAGPLVFLPQDNRWQKFKTSRFDHSVGVCLLLKKFGASLDEQITGLLHDISHTIFSHATDFLFNRQNEHDFHEKFEEKIILNSEIPEILEKHGININVILDKSRFQLLEKELPDLCADRIDYFMRDFYLYTGTKSEFELIMGSLKVYNDEFIFGDKNAAKIFAQKYIEANKLFWCNAEQSTLFKLISDVLRIGMSEKILSEEDLFSTDEIVYNKLKNSNNNEIQKILDSIRNLAIVVDANNYDFHLKSKVRCTNPKVIFNGRLSRLSDLDESYRKEMDKFITEYSKGFYVRIEV